MYENDVDFFTTQLTDDNRVKQAVWDDEAFKGLVSEMGLEDALYAVTDFHAMIADQLRSRGVSSPHESEWAMRAIGLCIRVKSRRQELRRAIRNSFDDGWERVERINAEVKADWSDWS